MEECPPGGDCTSGDYDPSKTDNPPALWTTNPGGEQAQGESMSKGDDGSQPAFHSPELKRKKVSSTTSASQVLKKHEDEFFDVIIPKKNLLWLKRKEVISEGLMSRIEAADTRDAKEILFEHLRHNADVAALMEYCKMAIAVDGFPRMQKLGEKMLNELTMEAEESLEKRVLNAYASQFRQVVAVYRIYRELREKKVIDKTVEKAITNSHSLEEARGRLFDHMRDYGTLDTLKIFCDVITSEEYDGIPAMQDFGSEIKTTLDQD